MSNSAKILLIIMIAIILIYVGVCVFNGGLNSPNDNENSGDSSGDVSGDAFYEDILPSGITYEITSGDNDISIIATASGDITTTRYMFEENALVQILVTEVLDTLENAEIVYNGIKEDVNLNQIYNSIDLNENTITMVLKQEYVDIFEGMTKEEIYDNQVKELEKNK